MDGAKSFLNLRLIKNLHHIHVLVDNDDQRIEILQMANHEKDKTLWIVLEELDELVYDFLPDGQDFAQITANLLMKKVKEKKEELAAAAQSSKVPSEEESSQLSGVIPPSQEDIFVDDVDNLNVNNNNNNNNNNTSTRISTRTKKSTPKALELQRTKASAKAAVSKCKTVGLSKKGTSVKKGSTKKSKYVDSSSESDKEEDFVPTKKVPPTPTAFQPLKPPKYKPPNTRPQTPTDDDLQSLQEEELFSNFDEPVPDQEYEEEEDNESSNNDDGEESTNFDWTEARTKSLLTAIEEDKTGFDNRKQKRSFFYEKIAKVVGEGCQGETVRLKWKQLEHTYKLREARKHKTGRGRNKEWPFQEAMDKILGKRPLFATKTVSSLDNVIPADVVQQTQQATPQQQPCTSQDASNDQKKERDLPAVKKAKYERIMEVVQADSAAKQKRLDYLSKKTASMNKYVRAMMIAKGYLTEAQAEQIDLEENNLKFD